jgi:hypothetical protein
MFSSRLPYGRLPTANVANYSRVATVSVRPIGN